jgi:hypothetical protein
MDLKQISDIHSMNKERFSSTKEMYEFLRSALNPFSILNFIYLYFYRFSLSQKIISVYDNVKNSDMIRKMIIAFS